MKPATPFSAAALLLLRFHLLSPSSSRAIPSPRTSAGARRFLLKFSVSARWHIGNFCNILNRASSVTNLLLRLVTAGSSSPLILRSFSSLPLLPRSVPVFSMYRDVAQLCRAVHADTRARCCNTCISDRGPAIRMALVNARTARDLPGKPLVGRRAYTRNLPWITVQRHYPSTSELPGGAISRIPPGEGGIYSSQTDPG